MADLLKWRPLFLAVSPPAAAARSTSSVGRGRAGGATVGRVGVQQVALDRPEKVNTKKSKYGSLLL